MNPVPLPRSAADLLTSYGTLPRAEQVAFLASLIQRGELPLWRIVLKPVGSAPSQCSA